MTPHRLHPGEAVEQAHCPMCGQPVLVDPKGQIVPHYGAEAVLGDLDAPWCEGLWPDWRAITFVGSIRVQHYGYRADALEAVEPGGSRRAEGPTTDVAGNRAEGAAPRGGLGWGG